jgi:hypothetical protein
LPKGVAKKMDPIILEFSSISAPSAKAEGLVVLVLNVLRM